MNAALVLHDSLLFPPGYIFRNNNKGLSCLHIDAMTMTTLHNTHHHHGGSLIMTMPAAID
jgi:hypothetical protein